MKYTSETLRNLAESKLPGFCVIMDLALESAARVEESENSQGICQFVQGCTSGFNWWILLGYTVEGRACLVFSLSSTVDISLTILLDN